jgi:uncharacterized membrane-anchored protein
MPWAMQRNSIMANHDDLVREIAEIKATLTSHIDVNKQELDFIRSMNERLLRIEQKFNKYGSLVTGIVMGVSAVWFVITGLLHYFPVLMHKLGIGQ